MSNDRAKAMGRILLHGYLLCGFLPHYINGATLYWILTQKEPSTDFIVKSFIECMDDGTVDLISKMNQATEFTPQIQHRILMFFTHHDTAILPTPSTTRSAFENVAVYRGLIQPHHLISNMRCNESRDVFSFLTQAGFVSMLEIMKPNGESIAAVLEPDFSDDDALKASEEDSFEFLLQLVKELDSANASKFLRFVSGVEVFDNEKKIRVLFNGKIGGVYEMLPTTNMCSVSLQLSRYFSSYEMIKNVFRTIFDNEHMWTRVDLI